VSDHGFLYGEGVYEVLRTYNPMIKSNHLMNSALGMQQALRQGRR